AYHLYYVSFFFYQAEDGIRDRNVTGVQTCALPICALFTRSLCPGRETHWTPGMHREGAFDRGAGIGVDLLHLARPPVVGVYESGHPGGGGGLRDGIGAGRAVGLLGGQSVPVRIDVTAVQVHAHQARADQTPTTGADEPAVVDERCHQIGGYPP